MIDQMAGEKERGEGFFSYTQEYRHLIKKKKKRSEKKRPIASEKKEFLKDRKKDEADKSKSQYSPNITRIPGRFVPQEIDSENLPFPSGSPEEGEKTRDGKIGREHHSTGVSSGDNDPFFFYRDDRLGGWRKNGGAVYHASLSTHLDCGKSALRESVTNRQEEGRRKGGSAR